MARLSKAKLADHSKFHFAEEEVDLPEIGGSVLVRSPSVQQREELAKHAPDSEGDWSISDTARLFSIVVVDPQVTAEEAEAFLGEWPGAALDRVLAKFAELIGGKEDLRDAVGEFQGQE